MMVSNVMVSPVIQAIIPDFAAPCDRPMGEALIGPDEGMHAMDDIETLRARVDALEMGRAHQERAIEDLSEALAAQWKQVEALQRQVARLADQVQDAAAAAPQGPEPPPPHY
jgi:SlyX protein